MADVIVVYKSKYGSTKQYAEWIAEESSADLVPLERFDKKTLGRYRTVVFGSSVYVGKMRGISFIYDNWPALESKNVIVFSVSSSDPSGPKAKEIMEENLKEEIRGKIKYFHLLGRVGEMDIFDRIMMFFPISVAQSKFNKTGREEDRLALEQLKHFDKVDRGSIRPIIAAIKGK